ncbi:hypothetical protein P3X46_005556 [Hevea brasiliensis]|uniref:TRF2/HOY1 PH-like domain-containing protein n=1 Tax=Hevea brasiliensis TaxID=3981 RepID=A0ABQ9N0X6_HEVBR|nr:uncharacterized protein LOC110639309 [Hevea brasiliensis]KAJ9185996.1 hypothetical protein P3X46_005556 [Hevea brasiliensis]
MAREVGESSGSFLWSSSGDKNANGGFSSTEEVQNPLLYGYVNQENDHNGSVCLLRRTEAANKRIKETPKQSNEQAQIADALLSLCPFGLKLNFTPSFIDSVGKNLNHSTSAAKAYRHRSKVDDFGSQQFSDKMKANNFSISLIIIGNWERKSKHEGDLVGKCYYAKKKLVWEFLERGLKSKIEIQWNDIIAMRVLTQEKQPGTLEIELNQPPTFHEETDPQPRKHTIWRLTSDFTRRQASICRRHYVMFPPGSLDTTYEKLVQCDRRFYELCQKPFPSLQSPYFEPNIFSFTNSSMDYPMDRPNVNPGLQFNFGIPSPLVAIQHVESYEQAPQPSFKERPSPNSVVDHVRFEIPRMAFWEQGISNNLAAADTFSPSILPFNQVDPTVSFQGNPLTYYGQGGDPNNHVNKMLTNLVDHLLGDTKVEGYDEMYHMARVESLNALVNLSQEENLATASEDSSQQTFYGQEMGTGSDDLVLGTIEQAIGLGGSGGGGQDYLQLVSNMPSQVCPSMQNFGPFNNSINQFHNRWT